MTEPTSTSQWFTNSLQALIAGISKNPILVAIGLFLIIPTQQLYRPYAAPSWPAASPFGSSPITSSAWASETALDSTSLIWLLSGGGLFFTGLLLAIPNFAGPLRFGIHTYYPNILASIQLHQLPTWFPSAFFLAVFIYIPRWWLLVTAGLLWPYVREMHREAVHKITDSSNEIRARASLASKVAHEDASSAALYEQKALELAASAYRDARQAEGIRVVDFHEKEADAWSLLKDIAEVSKDLKDAANMSFVDAENAKNAAPRDTSHAHVFRLFERAETAKFSAGDLEDEFKVAQKKVGEIEQAQTQHRKARERERANAEMTLKVVNKVKASAVDALAAARQADEYWEVANQCSGKAETAAEEGRMVEAEDWITKGKDASTDAWLEANKSATAKKECQRVYSEGVTECFVE